MITLRNTAGAYLLRGDRILLMRRSMEKALNPGQWAPVGGHMEAQEFERPMEACLREIQEETGISPAEIRELTLKYLLIRQEGGRLSLQYVFFGRTDEEALQSCEEGELFWVPLADLFDRAFPVEKETMLRHYFSVGAADCRVHVGLLDPSSGVASIVWQPLNAMPEGMPRR